MFGVINLQEYLLGLVAIILLPGPNSLYVLSVSAKYGVKEGYKGACGIFLGDTILMILATSGVASLLRMLPSLFVFFKIAGAIYLAWLGLNMLYSGLKTLNQGRSLQGGSLSQFTVDQERLNVRAPVKSNPFRRALGISLLNPKAILFFVAFFIQFVDKNYPYPVLSFGILGVLCQIASFLYLSALIFSGAKLAKIFAMRKKTSACLTASVGVLFFTFAAKLATADLK